MIHFLASAARRCCQKTTLASTVQHIITGFAALLLFAGCHHHSGRTRILVLTKTDSIHSLSLSADISAIQQQGQRNHFDVDTTSDASRITEDSLKEYAAVVFLNTTGKVLNNYEQMDLERYIQAGGGFLGIHAAAEAEPDWGWYHRLLGDSVLRQGTDDRHPGDSASDNRHPLTGNREFDGGRAGYIAPGNMQEPFGKDNEELAAGLLYVIGDDKELDYSKATALRVPEEARFTKTQLVEGTFFEPTEMTILPNLDVLIVQRRGEIMVYHHDTKTVRQVGYLDVYWKTRYAKVNSEEGLLGVQADPDFDKNHFIYVYYSPADSSVDRLSRFTFDKDTVDPASEKVVLQVVTQREICCHTGGSVAFGDDHTLFVSTGDNSTPFDEPGKPPYNLHSYAPLDDRPGFLQYDSRRGAGNTNDLRGKILRIKINADGTYGIPEGNLFPKGEDKTRPEIYVMGDRNPYRISVDKKNGYLYWGEVGPDAQNDSFDTRGPKGYDEVNQARQAGNFGWPYFVADNKPYHEYDFATGRSGLVFDPAKPVNNSRNNTGLHDLPPAQPAFVWYPYGQSKEFPQVGSGGRTAMAGPVYYSSLYPAATRLPEYYNGKFFMYDWVRGWIKAVTMLPNGDYDNMEPFMQHTKFNAPVDMEMGPDGKIYILEYGNGWFLKNADAGLVRIDYNAGELKAGAGNIAAGAPVTGQSLTQTLDCKTCHKENERTIGPSFREVSEKYAGDPKAMDYLSQKIRKGGSGVWGPVAMSAHPDIAADDLKLIIGYILALAPKDQQDPAAHKKAASRNATR